MSGVPREWGREDLKADFCNSVRQRIAAREGHEVNVPDNILLGLHANRNQKRGKSKRGTK